MNRNQRRYKYNRPKKGARKKQSNEIEEVFTPRNRRDMMSRCCYVAPDQNSFGNLTINSSFLSQTCSVSADVKPTPPNLIPKLSVTRPTKSEMVTNSISNHSFRPELKTMPRSRRPMLPDMPKLPNKKRPTRPNNSSFGRPRRPYLREPQKPPHKENADEVWTPQLDLKTPQTKELHSVFLPPFPKTEKSSQYTNPSIYTTSIKQTIRPRIENKDEIENYILKGTDEGTLTQYHSLPKNLKISETPRIKTMAVKFAKYKKDNIEVRRVEEKVVCAEYDVFDREVDKTKPVQRMRAFFSIKPRADENEEQNINEFHSTIKSQLNISTADLQKLNKKEIEIIDGKILENQPYLEDLRKLLRRRATAPENKNVLNLQALYEMGQRGLLDLNCNLDTMPEEELVEMQKMILKNCKSSVHGIRRRTIQNNSKHNENKTQSKISRSLVAELLRETN